MVAENNKYTIPAHYSQYFSIFSSSKSLTGFKVEEHEYSPRPASAYWPKKYLEVAIDEGTFPLDCELNLIKQALLTLQAECVTNPGPNMEYPQNKLTILAEMLRDYCHGEEGRGNALKLKTRLFILGAVAEPVAFGLAAAIVITLCMLTPPAIPLILILFSPFFLGMLACSIAQVLEFYNFVKRATLSQSATEAKLRALVHDPEFGKQENPIKNLISSCFVFFSKVSKSILSENKQVFHTVRNCVV